MTIEWNKVTWYSKLLAVIIFVATFCIGFCLGFSFGKNATEIGNINENYQAPAEIPQKKDDSTAQISISSQDIKEENFSGTMPLISGSGEAASLARTYILQRISEFRTQANADVPPMRQKFGADSPTAQYTIDINAAHITGDKTESIVLGIYAYTGGANGNSSYKVITSARTNGEILPLSAVIQENKETAFTEFVKKELNDWRPDTDAPVVFPDEVKDLKFDSFENWSLDDKNLTIYFDKFTIGPGYIGAVAFPIPLPKIKDFLK